MEFDFIPIILTFKLAAITTVILFISGAPLSYWLAFTNSRLKLIIETIVSMPLVLPPTVLGFYFLVVFGQRSPVGKFLADIFGIKLIFTFSGLIIASVIYSLPFMIQSLQAGFENFPASLIDASYTLGKSKFTTLIRVILPNMKPSILTGIVLSFAHTIGEFGVVMMMGGNIPGETKVASIALFDEVSSFNYETANIYAFVLFALSFSIIIILKYINRKIR